MSFLLVESLVYSLTNKIDTRIYENGETSLDLLPTSEACEAVAERAVIDLEANGLRRDGFHVVNLIRLRFVAQKPL